MTLFHVLETLKRWSWLVLMPTDVENRTVSVATSFVILVAQDRSRVYLQSINEVDYLAAFRHIASQFANLGAVVFHRDHIGRSLEVYPSVFVASIRRYGATRFEGLRQPRSQRSNDYFTAVSPRRLGSKQIKESHITIVRSKGTAK